MEVLVTNDDGIDAPGIQALASALEQIATVTIVAPSEEMSAVSHALTIKRSVSYERNGLRGFAVEGTPADCVSLAVKQFLPATPDVVVSGINRGANLAGDIAYSGTIGGAREAAMLGSPALAVSLTSKESQDYEPAALFATKVVQLVVQRGMGSLQLLNINVPAGPTVGVRVTRQGRFSDFSAPQMRRSGKRSRLSRFWGKRRDKEPSGSGGDDGLMSDVAAVREHFISVTPLGLDTTHYEGVEALKAWHLTEEE